jgi:hypothetical protein
VSGSGARQVGTFLLQQAPELTRIWRLARQAERGEEVFPGLLDGVVEAFVTEAGALLEVGGPPAEPFQRTAGTVRWPSEAPPAEHAAEWRLLGVVLQTACSSVTGDPDAARWLAAAIDAADAATAALDGGRGACPRGVVVLRVLSSIAPVDRER